MRKITKSQVKARIKRLKEGEKLDLTLFPSKCGPFNTVWVKGFEVEVDSLEEFEKIVNSFSYYNCNSELGNRVHFYVKENSRI